ncbi:MAG: hypothetical protein WBB01_02310, partial [Phormidesmis sp.]
MSAPTFDTLSAEVTQALTQQRHTPHRTTARCTLGRDKVMVLIEYPLSAKAEQTAMKTLNWLEQHLRAQFNTVGLPAEAADLAEAGEAVPVHLFLKYFSESKPFTMRSFVWKVEDSFDALFGHTQQGDEADEAIANSEPIFHDSSDYDFSEMLVPAPNPRQSAWERENDEPVLTGLERTSVRLEERAFDFEAELTNGGLPAVPIPPDRSDSDFFALLDDEKISAGDQGDDIALAADSGESLFELADWQGWTDDSSDAAEVASEIAAEIADEMSKLAPATQPDTEGDLEAEAEADIKPDCDPELDQDTELSLPESAALGTLLDGEQAIADTELDNTFDAEAEADN